MEIYLTNLGKYNEGYLVGEWVHLPVSDDDRALLSGMRGNESRPGTPFRASGTKLSVPSGGAVYGIGSCVGCGFLDPVFCHGKQEIPTGVG